MLIGLLFNHFLFEEIVNPAKIKLGISGQDV